MTPPVGSLLLTDWHPFRRLPAGGIETRNMITILQGDCRDCMRTLPAGSVHVVVTSPPYWGLRDYGNAGQIGLEKTPQEYVAAIVSVFAECWRVLRDDGVAWLNLGDTYNNSDKWGGGGNTGKKTVAADGTIPSWTATRAWKPAICGLKPKDLVGIPWRVAFGLQDAGWRLRSDCIWHKPNAMPESVTDRPAKSHEYVYLLAKKQRYFYDAEAVKEAGAGRLDLGNMNHPARLDQGGEWAGTEKTDPTRNLRSVWTISTKSCKLAHFAVMPPDLAETCIKSATSEHGCCPACGAPWKRVVEGKTTTAMRKNWAGSKEQIHKGESRPGGFFGSTLATTGWQPTCKCDRPDVVPCTVLDPFGGAGTTGLVADRLGRNTILCELNQDYVAICRKRLHEDAPLLASINVRECA